MWRDHESMTAEIKVFLLLFFQKKKNLLFLKRSKKIDFCSRCCVSGGGWLWTLVWLVVSSACVAQDIKVSTWNLNWFTIRPAAAQLPADVRPRGAGDIARLHWFADKLGADVVGFQEVDGAEAAAALFDPARYTIATIEENVVQRVGIAVRKPIRLRAVSDYAALDVTPDAPHRLRDGLDAMLDLPGGGSLRVLVVHLKTGCFYDDLTDSPRAACGLLARQVAPLAGWIAARAAERVPFVVMGDFNRVFDREEAMGDALRRKADLLRVTAGYANPCWGGRAFIDHIFLGGAARAWLKPGSLRVETYASANDDDKSRLSDHCPVSVTLDTQQD
jgi:endonuclease/exonuclease/phosphatase family metal-dependent hydrolase